MSALAASTLVPGDAVLVTEPGYPAFARVAREHHGEIHRAHQDPERGFELDLEGLDLERIRLTALNYPNNPTGAMIPVPTVDAMSRRLASDSLLFNDAVYGPLTYSDSPLSLLSAGAQIGLEQPTLELHSLSKLFALGPQGLAFLIGDPELILKLRTFTEYLWNPPSALQVELSTRALEDSELLEEVRRFFASRVARLRAVLGDAGFGPHPTPAGLYILCPLPARVAGRAVTNASEASEILLREHSLAVAGWDIGEHSYLRFSSLYLEDDLETLATLAGEVELAG